MFGYIKPYEPELKMAEFTVYKGVYCGLCKSLGRRFGFLSRLTLSYDFAFLAALAMAVQEEEPQFTKQACAFNPLHKKPCCMGNISLDFSADVAMIMLYHKLADDIADEPWYKRIVYRCLRLFAQSPFKKAAARLPFVSALLEETMQAQATLESQKCTDIDLACQPTAKALEGIFAQITDVPDQQRVLQRLGYLMGRFIYMTDALDDMEADKKQGSYNPFLLKYQATDAAQMLEVRQGAKASLYLTIGEIGKTYDLLATYRLGGVLWNILYLGLKNQVDLLLQNKACTGSQNLSQTEE